MKRSKLKKTVLLAGLLAAMIIAAGCGMSHEESLAQKDAWAEDLVRKSFIGLAQAGAMSEPASDAELLDEMFNYVYLGGIEFLDPRAESELMSGSYFLPKNSKVILATPSYSTKIPMEVFYYDKEKYMEDHGITDEKQADRPLFTPIYDLSIKGEVQETGTGAEIADAVDDSVFADGLDKADYLIVFDALDSYVETNYYKNGLDRTTVTTVVMVINVKQIAVEHIEIIDIDVPPPVYDVSNYFAHVDREGIVSYITALLTRME